MINIKEYMYSFIDEEVKNTDLIPVKQTKECYMIIRISDNKLFSERGFNRITDCKNFLRTQFFGLRREWSLVVFQKNWWELTRQEQNM